MKKFIKGYNPKTAPAINIPKLGHTSRIEENDIGIVSRSLKGIDNARQLLARDIRELRRVYPDIPNSKLRELIDLNKKMDYMNKMNIDFVKSLYESIIIEHMELYENIFNTTVHENMPEYRKKTLNFTIIYLRKIKKYLWDSLNNL